MTQQIGIVTLYRGYNYGTSLQAYALKQFVSSLGYDVDIIWTLQGADLGRDIRLDKILRMAWRCLWHPELLKYTFLSYKNSLSKPLDPQIKTKFLAFARQFLCINSLSKEQLKQFSYSQDTCALICGSDQIWNAGAANVEPLYFLRFAPQHKRIAYAPSFGIPFVPKYNQKTLTHYIREIPFISVREESGAKIVNKLTGKKATVLPDPTLLLDWQGIYAYQNGKPYVFAYFLDTPCECALKTLSFISQKYAYDIIVCPYPHKIYEQLLGVQFFPAGPMEFVSLIKGACCVLTDSFHGTAFSVNLGTPFWTFERNYASAKGQSTRITSLLEKTELQSHYITNEASGNCDLPMDKSTLQEAKKWIVLQRQKATDFLLHAIEQAGGINANKG